MSANDSTETTSESLIEALTAGECEQLSELKRRMHPESIGVHSLYVEYLTDSDAVP